MKIYFSNEARLFAYTMSNPLQVLSTSESMTLTEKKELVAVSRISSGGCSLLSDPYSASGVISFDSLHSDETPYKPLFLCVMGEFFQVAHVCSSDKECNEFTMSRDDVALLAIDNSDRMWIASKNPVSFEANRLFKR